MNRELEILRDRILKSKKFEKPPMAYGSLYVFDDFSINKTNSGDCTLTYRNHDICTIDERDLNNILNEKREQLRKEFFNENTKAR